MGLETQGSSFISLYITMENENIVQSVGELPSSTKVGFFKQGWVKWLLIGVGSVVVIGAGVWGYWFFRISALDCSGNFFSNSRDVALQCCKKR